jgi:excisionase family DNA binding protein
MTLQEFVKTWDLPPNVPIRRCMHILNVGNSKIYRLIAEGRLRLHKNGRNSEIPVTDIFEYVQGNSGDRAA